MDFPVVAGYARHNVVRGQCPALSHVAAVYPDVVVSVIQWAVYLRLLNDDAAHLTSHAAGYGQRGTDKFAAGAEMVKLATLQRQNGNGEVVELGINQRRVSAQRKAESAV